MNKNKTKAKKGQMVYEYLKMRSELFREKIQIIHENKYDNNKYIKTENRNNVMKDSRYKELENKERDDFLTILTIFA